MLFIEKVKIEVPEEKSQISRPDALPPDAETSIFGGQAYSLGS